MMRACRQESVVEPLIGRQHFRVLGLLRRVAKDLESLGLGPQEHFEVEEIQVFEGDEKHQNRAENLHVLSFAT